MKKLLSVMVLSMILGSVLSFSHGGRTDKNGCHINRKTNQRHCH